uniref:Uncharacterized protein n=1 Tax=Oryza glaberrima TaxID=4538 RepID=I1QWC3_ORYGL
FFNCLCAGLHERPNRVASGEKEEWAVAYVRLSSSSDAISYSSSISTDMPLYEPPEVSFDEYLLDCARVFHAMFPDKSRSQRPNDTKWELRGLERGYASASFDLGIRGSLYTDRRVRD